MRNFIEKLKQFMFHINNERLFKVSLNLNGRLYHITLGVFVLFHLGFFRLKSYLVAQAGLECSTEPGCHTISISL